MAASTAFFFFAYMRTAAAFPFEVGGESGFRPRAATAVAAEGGLASEAWAFRCVRAAAGGAG